MKEEVYETIAKVEPKEGEPSTHDTFVLGYKNERIVFIKSYDFKKQRDEAMQDLEFVQKNFEGWKISHAGNWILESKLNSEGSNAISIPLP